MSPQLTRQSHMTSFAQFLQEDDERFYETFPSARAAKDAQHVVPQNWSIQQLGQDNDVFNGDFVFFYNNEPDNCYLEHATPHPPTFYQSPPESLYTIPESIPYTDVNRPQAPFNDHSSQCQPQVSSPPPRTLDQSLVLHAVEPPPLDYLPSPESPQSIYSPVDTQRFFSADPTPANDPVPSQSHPSPIPQQSFFKADISPVPAEHSPSPTAELTFVPSRKRRRTSSDNQHFPPPEAGRSYVYKIPLPKPNHIPVPRVPKRRPTTPQTNEKKNLALACFFCRGRKIACGPHDPNSSDRTCGQCHRRSLKCEYPTESRRGMRKKRNSVEFPPGSAEQRQQDLGTLSS
ncbi:hypothetical protein L218DRAFT_1071561 [Marasmius fiardii PR-910]|nr:hypothetical protein L218DRAFT_1071561 [Marasmius fiardii PR-910]